MCGQIGVSKNICVVCYVPIERDTTGHRGIIEENGHATTIMEGYDIGFGTINPGRSLPRCQNGIHYAALRHNIKALDIHCGLSQPHAMRVVTITITIILQAPEDLSALV